MTFSTNITQAARLLFVAALFMFLFQLEARLINYIYPFHQGLLLIESALVGGGLFIILRHLAPAFIQKWFDNHIALLIAGAFFVQIAIYITTRSFVFDFLLLSTLFGLLFLNITHFVKMPANRFLGFDLLGSFFGVGLYALAISFFLEEVLIAAITVVVMLYAVAETCFRFRFLKLRVLVIIFLIIGGAVYAHIFTNNPLPTLVVCTEDTYKSVCAGDAPVASYTHIKGRGDIYVREYGTGENATRKLLHLHNNGSLFAYATQRDDFAKDAYAYFEPDIPKLPYKDNAAILLIGSSVGGNVQAYQKYSANPVITGLEIDGTIPAIVESDDFADFAHETEKYTLYLQEGRRFIEQTEAKYDVISANTDSIMSVLGQHGDERTSLLYSVSAIREYLSQLNPDGYLILLQYFPEGQRGNAMAAKILGTLSEATNLPPELLKERVILNSFGANPESGFKWLTIVYKNGGIDDEDRSVFADWVGGMQAFTINGTQNPQNIQPLHLPATKSFESRTFTPYFDKDKRARIASLYNTDVVTDDKPFRHLITKTPFPATYYVFFLGIFAVTLLLLGTLTRRKIVHNQSLLLFSALFGILTFGLQYLLFYKTAAFLNTNLIFFAVFLLIPLFFSALGGFLSNRLSRVSTVSASVLFLVLSFIIATLDIFESSHLFVFAIIAALFTISGFLFPLILSKSRDAAERSILYATNLVAGGSALVLMVTFHATFGWLAAFATTALLIAGGLFLAGFDAMLER